MPLFLITSLFDEGISPSCFRVVEADSELAVAQHMLAHPQQWGFFLRRAFHESLGGQVFTPQQFLDRIEQTYVDGDSDAQLRISKITVHPLNEVNTEPFFGPGTQFSDFA